jgi:hypothetical protein
MDRTVTFKQEEISYRVSQPGLDAKTDKLTDRQSQCDFDFDLDVKSHKLRTVHNGTESCLRSQQSLSYSRISHHVYG